MKMDTDQGPVEAPTFGALAVALVRIQAREVIHQTNDGQHLVQTTESTPLAWLQALAELLVAADLPVEGGDIPADYDQGAVLGKNEDGPEVQVLVHWTWSGSASWVPLRTLRLQDPFREAWTIRALAQEARDELTWDQFVAERGASVC